MLHRKKTQAFLEPHLRCLLTLLLAASLVVVSAHAWAQDATAAASGRAAAAKERGDAAMGDLRYAEALTAYREAYALDPNPALLYNEGRALEALRRFPDALEQLEAFSTKAAPELKAQAPQLDELIADLRKKVTTLWITANVPGARILIGNVAAGWTPLAAALRLNAETVSIEVTREGYAPFRTTVALPGGGETRVDARLVLLDTRGVLRVQASVPASEVWLDGSLVGRSPAEALALPGSHRVRVHRSGYEDFKTTVVLGPSEHKQVVVTLREEAKPVTSRWWFWTSIGVTVAGGVALGAALLTESSPSNGDFDPGRVGAPLIAF